MTAARVLRLLLDLKQSYDLPSFYCFRGVLGICKGCYGSPRWRPQHPFLQMLADRRSHCCPGGPPRLPQENIEVLEAAVFRTDAGVGPSGRTRRRRLRPREEGGTYRTESLRSPQFQGMAGEASFLLLPSPMWPFQTSLSQITITPQLIVIRGSSTNPRPISLW